MIKETRRTREDLEVDINGVEGVGANSRGLRKASLSNTINSLQCSKHFLQRTFPPTGTQTPHPRIKCDLGNRRRHRWIRWLLPRPWLSYLHRLGCRQWQHLRARWQIQAHSHMLHKYHHRVLHSRPLHLKATRNESAMSALQNRDHHEPLRRHATLSRSRSRQGPKLRLLQ